MENGLITSLSPIPLVRALLSYQHLLPRGVIRDRVSAMFAVRFSCLNFTHTRPAGVMDCK